MKTHIKRFFDVTFPYDFTKLKQTESLQNSEFSRRMLVIFLAVSFITVAFDTTVFVVWMVLYMAYVLIFQRHISKLPDRGTRREFRITFVYAVLDAIFYNSMVYLTWAQDDVAFKYVSLVALHGAMLNVVSRRAVEPVLALSNAGVIVFIGLTLPVFDFIMYGREGDYLVLLVVLYMSMSYFIMSLYQAVQAHRLGVALTLQEAHRTKLESLGQLTGGVAHDFNNLLTVILGNLDLRRELPDEEEREELLTEVEMAAHKAAQLTNQLLVYSRRSALDPTRTELHKPLERAQSLLTRLLPASLRLVIDLPDRHPEIEVDVGKLEVVVVNLVLNARDAMPDGGVIRVNVRLSRPDDRSRAGHTADLAPKPYLVLSVQDEGHGIPEDQLERVLEPYYTTKSVGKGSGLGLSMALGFAEQSGGALTIDSVEGEGTEVSLWFPLCEPEGHSGQKVVSLRPEPQR